ncbi:hypothetical protein DM02DRAFT_540932, partial [Periconia macrospinosa]
MSFDVPDPTPKPLSHKKRFKCSQCDKAYTRKFILQEHERTHTGEKPEHCPKCPKSYARKSDLQRHIKTCGSITKAIYNCHVCSAGFSRNNALKKHQ